MDHLNQPILASKNEELIYHDGQKRIQKFYDNNNFLLIGAYNVSNVFFPQGILHHLLFD